MKPSVGIVGAGNVASHLAYALNELGYSIEFIFSESGTSAKKLADEIGTKSITGLRDLNADIILICISDDQIQNVGNQLVDYSGLVVHTSGAVEMGELYSPRKGVLYPFQTISRDKEVDWKKVPLVIESNSETDLSIIRQLAVDLSDQVIEADSDSRRALHLTGVLSNNFTNYLTTVSFDLLRKYNLNTDLLLPIIEETTQKIKMIGPENAQTGPAIRGDQKTIQAHLSLLEGDPNLHKIYELLTKSIQDRY